MCGDRAERIVHPEDVTTAAHAASRRLLPTTAVSEPPALHTIASRLAEETKPLLASFLQNPSSPHRPDAAFLTLTARTLAAIADHHLHDPELAELYHTATAGLITLRNRTDGTTTPTETLILTHT